MFCKNRFEYVGMLPNGLIENLYSEFLKKEIAIVGSQSGNMEEFIIRVFPIMFCTYFF